MNTIFCMVKNIDVFEKMPVPKAVFKMAVPTVLSMIVAVFYNMVDAFFVGMIGDPSQFAAVNVATPVFMFLMAAGNIFGMGGSSYISRALGRKEYNLVNKASSFCFYAGIGTGIIGGAVILIFMTPILHGIGTTETTFGFAREYLSVVAWGGPLIVLSNAYSNVIRGEGAAKVTMNGMMAGTIVNIILDPIFILKEFLGIKLLGMGVAGAAIATLIGNAVSLVIYVRHIVSKNSALSIHPKYYQAKNGIMAGVLSIGLPASLTNILMSFSSIITNKLLASYYAVQVTSEKLLPKVTTFIENVPVFGDVPTAAMGVALKANMLAIFVMLGVGIGVSPLIGYNYGARNLKRMKSVLKFAVLCNIISGTTITILYFIFTKQIINIFSSDAAVVEMGQYMIYSLMASTPVLGVLFCLNFTFQAIGKGKQSLIIAVSRQGLVFFPLIFIMNHFIGLYGIIWAQPVADAVSLVVAFSMFIGLNRDFHEIEAENEALQLI